MPHHLFVYGTLHPDRAPAEIAPTVAHLRELGPGTISGRLHDLGPYPAAVPDPTGTHQVPGTLFELPNDPKILAALDHYEGYDPHNLPTSLYRREQLPVTLPTGQTLTAWVYLYNQPVFT